MVCLRCNDTGIDPKVSDVDMGNGIICWIEGYCDCPKGEERLNKEMCLDCGEKKEACICGNSESNYHP